MSNLNTTGSYSGSQAAKKKLTDLSDEEELKVLNEFEKDFQDGKDWLNKHYDLMEADEEFVFEDQWDKNERQIREGAGVESRRPCLTFNKTLRLGKRIVNDIKQAHYGIKIIPVDTGADPLIAEVYQALIKKIEKDNRCESVRQSSFEQALFGGAGFYRIYSDWIPGTMSKQIICKRVTNRRMVLFSRTSQEPDLSDSPWFIIHELVPKDEAKAKYPGVEFKENYEGSQYNLAWYNGEGFIISEQFKKKLTPGTVIMLDDQAVLASAQVDEPTKAMWRAMAPGYKETVVWDDELDAQQKILWEQLPKAFRTQYSRPSSKETWMWYKCAGREVIAYREWTGTMAPVVFMRGREYWLKGKRNWMSFTKMLKDPQILYNYYRSTQAERLTMAADAPWLLTAEHIAGYEDLWRTAHTRPLRYLLYNLKHNNEDLPEPKRTNPIMGDPGLDNEVQRLDHELLDISGINLATLGESSGERTGKAILVRQRQGELINADFPEGYVEAMYREGQIYLDIIPKELKWDQAVRLLGDDYKELVQKLTDNNLLGWGNGKYDLEIEIGSVSSTAREDERQFWTDMIQANPQIAPLVMDVLVENVGNKKAKLLARRFQAMMPPQVQGITELDDAGISGKSNPEAEQIKQAADQHIQGLNQKLQETSQQAQQATQQTQQVTSENNKLKSDMTIRNREIDIKNQELYIKKVETLLKAAELKMNHHVSLSQIALEMKQMENDATSEPGTGPAATNSGTVSA